MRLIVTALHPVQLGLFIEGNLKYFLKRGKTSLHFLYAGTHQCMASHSDGRRFYLRLFRLVHDHLSNMRVQRKEFVDSHTSTIACFATFVTAFPRING